MGDCDSADKSVNYAGYTGRVEDRDLRETPGQQEKSIAQPPGPVLRERTPLTVDRNNPVKQEHTPTLWTKVTEGFHQFLHTSFRSGGPGVTQVSSEGQEAESSVKSVHNHLSFPEVKVLQTDDPKATFFTRLSTSISSSLSTSTSHLSIRMTSSPVVFLAKAYPSLHDPDFQSDFVSRPWITYRSGFPPVSASSTYTSDVGWGCMIRSGQMMLASAFVAAELGRDWRINSSQAPETFKKYIQILTQFHDSPDAPFSLQKIAQLGRQYGIEVGQWFGPSTISQALSTLAASCPTSPPIHMATDGLLDKSAIISSNDTDSSGIIILVPVRLGVDEANPVYHAGVRACFNVEECIGIAGGRPNSSLFFMGIEGGSNLIYLDPHVLRPMVKLPPDLSTSQPSTFQSYHCDAVRTMPISAVDPSLVLGFYLKDRTPSGVQLFCSKLEKLEITKGRTPLFTVADRTPTFSDRDGEVMSDEDDF
ncbi:hypothetical protein DFS34DRAFT_504463 [Phlyctochytrium arcticum]|nr:hypothetical protein DFS34DRAFT_504463 [Phlyctochytrium arcticum]